MEYVVKVSDLLEKIQEIANERMTYVKLEYLDEEFATDSTCLPSILLFQAIKENNTCEIYDYEFIDVYDDKKF